MSFSSFSCRPAVTCFCCRESWNCMYNPSSFIRSWGCAYNNDSCIINGMKSATTPVNDPANECPAAAVSGATPSAQFPGAVERSTLPLACVGPLYNIALCGIDNVYLAGKTELDNLHLILPRAQAYQVGGFATHCYKFNPNYNFGKQPYLALTDNYKWSDNCP
ncbi:hypothetical protein T02_11959 [Trichinella nativa]|uniref:Uncharacterized protein n=1 Tax=Trichinella nativa TaxID=6335 RepID=A0A0V1LC13_9BILA|nr:hypothetical protein T02_11959 [Trichinella nativa]